MIKEILVPIDGSEHANKAIEFAADMAKQNDATIHLLHVFEQTGINEALEDYIRSERLKGPPENVYIDLVGTRFVGQARDDARSKGVKDIVTSVLGGDPAQEIINYARDHRIDMIVMGTQGLGSVTAKVCAETPQTCVIVKKALLDGKKVLIVDDEPDILETLEELLPMCDVAKASNFDEAKALLETQHFDLAILDIMGVNGYELLDLATKRKVIAVMLTAHALSPEDTIKSFERGAASYVPKDKMTDIETYLNDTLEAKERGKHFWWRWFERFGSYYEKKFGSDLQKMMK